MIVDSYVRTNTYYTHFVYRNMEKLEEEQKKIRQSCDKEQLERHVEMTSAMSRQEDNFKIQELQSRLQDMAVMRRNEALDVSAPILQEINDRV